jgi:hypothetical protein
VLSSLQNGAPILEEALTAAREIQDRGDCEKTLAEIAPMLQHDQECQMLTEALEVTREIQDKGARAMMMAKITAMLQEQKSIDYNSL